MNDCRMRFLAVLAIIPSDFIPSKVIQWSVRIINGGYFEMVVA